MQNKITNPRRIGALIIVAILCFAMAAIPLDDVWLATWLCIGGLLLVGALVSMISRRKSYLVLSVKTYDGGYDRIVPLSVDANDKENVTAVIERYNTMNHTKIVLIDDVGKKKQ